MCAVPLRVRTDIVGALNVFRGSDVPFTGDEMAIAQAMGEVAAIALIQERALREHSLLTGQLQAALNSRVVIEQAKGMLSEYLNVTVSDAFELPRTTRGNTTASSPKSPVKSSTGRSPAPHSTSRPGYKSPFGHHLRGGRERRAELAASAGFPPARSWGGIRPPRRRRVHRGVVAVYVS